MHNTFLTAYHSVCTADMTSIKHCKSLLQSAKTESQKRTKQNIQEDRCPNLQ